MAYVAETDKQAEEEFMPHCMYFFETALKTTPRYLMPPGYLTVPEFRKRLSGPDVHGNANWNDLTAINRVASRSYVAPDSDLDITLLRATSGSPAVDEARPG